tara:strand:+ start:258 stop:614 length:357 start_codon:yes stop_codon:yes gene_type:complete
MFILTNKTMKVRRSSEIKYVGQSMSRKCELTGKTVQVGNNVSHAKNRTKRRFLPNLSNVTLSSEVLGKSFKFKVAASTLRTVDAKGGLDPFLMKVKDDLLSSNALKVKRQIISIKSPS